MNTQEFHAANRKRWDKASRKWAERADRRGLWKRCTEEPELVLRETELEYLSDISGKRVCVLGSGDNQVAFALVGLGARVTSVDFSQKQLDIAKARSVSLGLDIAYLKADVTDLSCLDAGVFDAAYTGGHVAVWVSDLVRFYSEAARVLRPGGLLIVNEYHPFRRIWQTSKDSLIVETGYLERGPFEYELDDDILRPTKGALLSYEYHWTVADYLNAVLKADCRPLLVDEYGDEVGDWEGAPMAGLPEFILIVARKSQ